MRGIKTMTGLRVVTAGHAFVQNLRRGHYEIATDELRGRQLARLHRTSQGHLTASMRHQPAGHVLLSNNATDPLGR
jgi:hypothetical protein